MAGMTKAVATQWFFSIAKPDAVRRGLVGTILNHFEAKELILQAAQFLQPSEALIRENYRKNEDEPWFEEMVHYMTSGPVLATAWLGPNAVDSGRQVIGEKDPWKSDAGSLRGKYAHDPIRTLVHGSRDAAESLREINLWFPTLLGVDTKSDPDPPPVAAFTRPISPLALKTFVAVREQWAASLDR